MKIEFSEETMREVVAEALFKSIPDDKRDTLIKEAVASLLTPVNIGYGKTQSPLQKAFEAGVYAYALEAVKAQLQEDGEVKQLIEETVLSAIRITFRDNQEQTATKIASAISDAFAPQ